MAITFNIQRERQRILIPIAGIIMVLAIIIVYFGLLRPSTPSLAPSIPIGETAIPQIEIFNIDFNFFERDDFKNFTAPMELMGPPSTAGRSNPFLPY